MKKKYLSVLGLAPLALLAACSSSSYKIVDVPKELTYNNSYGTGSANAGTIFSEKTNTISFLNDTYVVFKISPSAPISYKYDINKDDASKSTLKMEGNVFLFSQSDSFDFNAEERGEYFLLNYVSVENNVALEVSTQTSGSYSYLGFYFEADGFKSGDYYLYSAYIKFNGTLGDLPNAKFSNKKYGKYTLTASAV